MSLVIKLLEGLNCNWAQWVSNNRSSSTRHIRSWVSDEKISQPSACNLFFLTYLAAWQLWCMNIENEKGHSAHWGSSFPCTLFSQDIYNHYLNDPSVFYVHNFALWGLLTFIIWQLKKVFLIALPEFIFLSLPIMLATHSSVASWTQ